MPIYENHEIRNASPHQSHSLAHKASCIRCNAGLCMELISKAGLSWDVKWRGHVLCCFNVVVLLNSLSAVCNLWPLVPNKEKLDYIITYLNINDCEPFQKGGNGIYCIFIIYIRLNKHVYWLIRDIRYKTYCKDIITRYTEPLGTEINPQTWVMIIKM